MPITVNYNPSAVIGWQVAAQTGAGQRAERLDTRNQQLRRQDQSLALQQRAQDIQAQQFQQNLQAEQQAQATAYQQQKEMSDQQYQQQLILNYQHEQGQIDYVDYQYKLNQKSYTDMQQRQLSEIENNIATVQQDPTLNANEREYAIRQLNAKKMGIQPTPMMSGQDESPWAPGKRPGEIWTDESTGMRLTRDSKGEVNVLGNATQYGGYDMNTISKLTDQAMKSLTTVNAAGGEIPPSPEQIEAYVMQVVSLQQKVRAMAGASTKPIQPMQQQMPDPQLSPETLPSQRGGGQQANPVQSAQQEVSVWQSVPENVRSTANMLVQLYQTASQKGDTESMSVAQQELRKILAQYPGLRNGQ